MKYLLLVLLCLVFVVGCEQQLNVPVTPPQATADVYTNQYYSIGVPEGWIVAPAESVAAVSLLKPEDPFVNIVVETETTDLDLQEYYAEFFNKLNRSQLYVGTVIQNYVPQNAYGGLSVKYSYHLGYTMDAQAVVFVKNNRAYTVIYQAEQGHFAEYEQYFGEAMNSYAMYS